MEKQKFYSIQQFEFNDYSTHHGYFFKFENAKKKALEVVANMQKEIVEMRRYVKADGLDDELYKEDMHEVKDTRWIKEWKGNHNGLIIYKHTTED